MQKIFEMIFGTESGRIVKKYRKVVEKINAMEPAILKLTQEEMRARVQKIKEEVGAKVSPEGGDLEGALETLLNQTIKKVSEDYEDWKFNTAISQMMIFVNEVEKQEFIDIKTYKILLQLLSPICPFFTEEIWNSLGEKKIYLSI